MPDDAKEPTPQEKLRSLVDEILAAEEFNDDHIQRIHDHALAAAKHIRAELDWSKTAHVHNAAHVFRGDDETGSPTAKSTFACHDCGRELVSDMGVDRILICPKLHGRRPRAMRPTKPHGAVECGQPGI